MDDDEDERATELSTVASIYPELEIDPTDFGSATLELPVNPATALPVRFSDKSPLFVSLPSPPTSEGGQSEARDVHELSYLPPLLIRISLPPGYPESEAPRVHLSLAVPYLSRATLDALQVVAAALWEGLGHTQAVFAYIDHLQEASEQAFHLAAEGPLRLPSALQAAMLDYDLQAKQRAFDRQTFACGVCLDPKRGSACHRLPCSHVFCKACLQDFYVACITEGDIASVKCLDPGCAKTAAETGPSATRIADHVTLTPDELLGIPIPPETIQRYVKLGIKAAIEADKNTVYCPRKWCQGAARTGDTDEPPTDPHGSRPRERLAICRDCSYAFCRWCFAGWHGEQVHCYPPEVREQRTAEDQASEEYMRKYSSPCPTCGVPCQKSMGCNHMICFKCKSHFCYLCGAWLPGNNPYAHFNMRETDCYLALWELEAGDGADAAGARNDGDEEAWAPLDDSE